MTRAVALTALITILLAGCGGGDDGGATGPNGSAIAISAAQAASVSGWSPPVGSH